MNKIHRISTKRDESRLELPVVEFNPTLTPRRTAAVKRIGKVGIGSKSHGNREASEYAGEDPGSVILGGAENLADTLTRVVGAVGDWNERTMDRIVGDSPRSHNEKGINTGVAAGAFVRAPGPELPDTNPRADERHLKLVSNS